MATDYTPELQAAMAAAGGGGEAPPGAEATGGAPPTAGRAPTCDCQTPEECFCQVRMQKGEIPQPGGEGEGA